MHLWHLLFYKTEVFLTYFLWWEVAQHCNQRLSHSAYAQFMTTVSLMCIEFDYTNMEQMEAWWNFSSIISRLCLRSLSPLKNILSSFCTVICNHGPLILKYVSLTTSILCETTGIQWSLLWWVFLFLLYMEDFHYVTGYSSLICRQCRTVLTIEKPFCQFSEYAHFDFYPYNVAMRSGLNNVLLSW